MMKKVEIKSKRYLLDDFFKVEEVYLRYERYDGEMSEEVRRLNFERGDGVAAILFNRDSRRVILIEQFRYPAYEKGPGWMVETIAGMREEGEDPEEAMRREILEEVGYQVDQLRHISTFYVSPGGASERIFLYYAEVDNAALIDRGGGLAHESEDIQAVEFSLPELWAALDAGRIVDAKTIIGLMWLRRNEP
jgi:nudix-type nucleoside diphosphatase (YffH/AdpP family)